MSLNYNANFKRGSFFQFNSVCRVVVMDVLLCILGLLFISFLILKNKFYLSIDGDVAPQTYALFSFVGRCLRNGELPLWNPCLWGGEVNLGNFITQAFYPINWILCYLFYDVNNQYVGFEIVVYSLIAHVFIYFLGLFFLLKKIGLKNIFAFFIALLSISSYSFSNYWSWLGYLCSVSWFPFIILTTVSLAQTTGCRKSFLLVTMLGVEFGMVALLGAGSALVIEAVFSIILYFYCLKHKKSNMISKLDMLKIFFAGGLGILLALPVLLSNIDFLKSSLRNVPGMGFIKTNAPVPFQIFLEHKVNNFDVLFSLISVKDFFSIHGIVTLLMVVGVFSMWRQKAPASPLQKVSFVSVVLSLLLGFAIFVPDFVYYIPFLNALREMYMYGIFFNLFSAILSGYGVRTLLLHEKERKLSKGVFVFVVFFLLYNVLPHKYPVRSVYVISLLTFVFFLLCLLRKYTKIAKALFCLVCALSLYKYSKIFNQFNISGDQAIDKVRNANEFNKNSFLKLKLGDTEKIGLGWGNAVCPTNQGVALGYREILNYCNPMSEVAINAHFFPLDKRAQLQNVRYFLISEANDNVFINWFSTAFQNIKPTGVKYDFISTWSEENIVGAWVYKVDTFGPAWFVADYDFYTDCNAAMDWVNSSNQKLDEKALVNKCGLSKRTLQSLESVKTAPSVRDVSVALVKNNKIVYNTNCDVDAILVTSEMYNKGWKVYIDGKKHEVLNLDYCNRGVVVPKGNHVVKFVYRPNSFIIGCVGQIVAVVVMLFVFGAFVFNKDRVVRQNGK